MHSLRGKRALILSGERGLGKTSLALELASLLRAAGRSVGGVASPSERGGDGIPTEVSLVDLRSGESRLLASRSRDLGGPSMPGRRWSPDSLAEPPPFSFSREALAWGAEILRREIEAAPDLIVLDEVGPLEIKWDSGFREVLEGLIGAAGGPGGPREVPRVLVTTRPSLAAVLAARFAAGTAAVVELTEENRGSLAEKIAKRLA